MAYTDELDLWHIDKKTKAMAERLTRQARLSIDTVGRDAICAGLNVMYAGTNTARGTIQSTDVLTYAMFPKVAPKFFEYRAAQQLRIDPEYTDKEQKIMPV